MLTVSIVFYYKPSKTVWRSIDPSKPPDGSQGVNKIRLTGGLGTLPSLLNTLDVKTLKGAALRINVLHAWMRRLAKLLFEDARKAGFAEREQ